MTINLIGLIRRNSPRTVRAARLVRAGNAANASRRWADAAKAYAAALELTPGRAGVLVQYGHALKEQGYLPEAEAAYLRSARIDPLVADTHLQIGHVMKLQGDLPRAIAAYEAAHRLEPQMHNGRQELLDLRRVAPDTPIPENLHLQDRGMSHPQVNVSDPIGALLRRAQIGDAFLPMFDPFYYRHANGVAVATASDADLLACLRHFCTVGVERVLPFAPEFAFDATFYCETYLGGMTFTPARAYRHWLNIGLLGAAAPNRRMFAQRLLGEVVAGLDKLDLVAFGAQTDPDAIEAPWHILFERFVAEAADPERQIAPDEANVSVYVAISNLLERGDHEQVERAFRLRQIVATRVPSHRGNRLQLAEMLRRRGCHMEAVRLYQALEEEERPPAMIFVGLAACEGSLARPAQALDAAVRGCHAFSGDQGMRWQRFDRSQRLFGLAWDLGMAAARAGRAAEGQAHITEACQKIGGAYRGAYSGANERQTAPRTIRRVALASHAPLPQCKFYRVDQTAEQLEAMGFTVMIFDLVDQAQAFQAAIHALDAVVFCRVPALPVVIDAVETATASGLTTFYDMDDLIFDPVFPDPIESYGGLLSRDDHAGLVLAVPLFDQAMRMCAFGISSTASLAEAMRSRVSSGQVFLRPNALGLEHMRAIEGASAIRKRDDDGQVTLFYGSGGKAHKADFERLVEPALVALVRAHGAKISIVLMGEFPATASMRQIADNVTVLPPLWDRQAYWSILGQADINLAVLLPGPAADAKSEIKWLEAAMLGIPSVVSDTATYRAVVRPGETGMICRTAQEWAATLDRLVRDRALRQRIGAAARAQALAEYGARTVATRLHDAVMAVSPAEDALPLIVVAHVFYPPQAIGGATRVVHDNVRDILKRAGERFRIELFSCLDGGEPYALTSDAQDGVRVTRVGSPDVDDLESRPTDERMGDIFGAYLDAVQPALVHFHCIQRLTASIVLATAQRHIPYIVTVHDGWWISDYQFLLDDGGHIQTYDLAQPVDTLRRQGMEAYLRMGPLRQALFGAERVLAVSEPFAEIYRACGVPNVLAVENGVPALPMTMRQPAADGKVWLGFIGGLARHKGVDLVRIAIHAWPYKHLALLLIDHALPAGAVQYEQWGSVDVEIRPKWPQDDVGALYGRIDVLLAPSVWPESFGLVTREAAASGCFVIASDRGSIGSFLRDGIDGFVIDVSSPDGLTDALKRIDADPCRFRQPVVDRLTLRPTSAQADEIVAVYDSVLAAEDSERAKRGSWSMAGTTTLRAETAAVRLG